MKILAMMSLVVFTGFNVHADEPDHMDIMMSGCKAVSHGISSEVFNRREKRMDVLFKNISALAQKAIQSSTYGSDKDDLMEAIVAETKKMDAIEKMKDADFAEVEKENQDEISRFCY